MTRAALAGGVCSLNHGALVALAGVLPALGCAGDDGGGAGDLVGTWFACADADCETLARDGFELEADGTFTRLRLDAAFSGKVSDLEAPDDAEYCEVPFGSYAYAGGSLELTPAPKQDSQDAPRTVRFAVNGNRAMLTEADGADMGTGSMVGGGAASERSDTTAYLRIVGSSSGPCSGVLDP